MFGQIWSLIKRTFQEWSEDNVTRLSASLAYYTTFSIPPLLIIAVTIAGWLFGQQAAQGRVAEQLTTLLGATAADAIEAVFRTVSTSGPRGWVATALGVIALLYGAISVFSELQDSMDLIWEVRPKPGRFWWQILRDRLLSFVMVVGTAFLLLVSLTISAGLAALSGRLQGFFIWRLLNPISSLVVFTIVFAAIFRWVPDVRIAWRDVGIGAFITAVLFTIGKALIGLYLGQGMSSFYGAAGSVLVLLLWVYYSAQILFLGAEFTQVYARRTGKPIEPSRGATRITEIERARAGETRNASSDEHGDADRPKS